MAFSSKLESADGAVILTLAGDLDAAAAPAFQKDVEHAAAEHAQRLVLIVQDLDYIASAGLRILIFAKQKMGTNVDIYVVGAQEQVIDTLQKTGFDRSIILQDTYA
jgi:anti-anti-sigma factor